jgi:ATP-dependent exoDNAse (exonuclease V) beta subunit
MAPIHATGASKDRIYDYLKRMHARKSEFEAGRLLYVAATRAKSELHLFGHAAAEAEDGVVEFKAPEAGSLLERMWSVAKPAFAAAAPSAPPPEMDDKPVRRPLSMRRMARDWQLPAVPPSVAVPGAADPKDPARERVSYRWAGDTLRHVGTVVHRVLRRIAEDGLADWDAARIERGVPAYRSALAELGVAATELEQAAQTVREALSRTVSDARGQ